jgi:predicted RNase H-like HicB family nuclease
VCEFTQACKAVQSMAQKFYPAVLEKGAKGGFAVWFPDFPDAVAAARTQEEVMSRAQDALSRSVFELYENGRTMPEPTPFEKIEIPRDCELITLVALGVDPPDPSERVNVYLSKSLLERVDRRAADIGMSRSSYFGFAANLALGIFNPADPKAWYLSPEAAKRLRFQKPRKA